MIRRGSLLGELSFCGVRGLECRMGGFGCDAEPRNIVRSMFMI